MSDKLTETEKLFDEITEEITEETPEEVEETTEEETPEEIASEEGEILTDEQLEEAREVESYRSKIEQLDERLAELKTDKTMNIRRKAMEDARYSSEQIERYAKFIEGETEEEARLSVMRLDIPAAGGSYINQTPMGGGDGKPRRRDGKEVGRNAIQRVLDKIRL